MPHAVQFSLTRAQAEAVQAVLADDLRDNYEAEDSEQVRAALRKVTAALDAVGARHQRVSVRPAVPTSRPGSPE